MSLNGSSALQADLFDSKRRSVLLKQSNFTKKNGRRHHGFDKEKAPYPLSFDRAALNLDVIDHVFLKSMKGSVSFTGFPDGTPKRCLDLGCGTGTWILDAVNEWPDCEFVGFDLVSIQPPVNVLDLIFTSRVQWVHGNFLTTKLPFEDDEFDHVHVKGIARAVPESKWGYLFEEISRILRPGGSLEMVEEDIDFPILPRWYTRALRMRDRGPSIHLPNGTDRQLLPMSPPPTPPRGNGPAHSHALLESLFNSVFETRFINRNPTSILPSYFATHFCHVLISPAINFPSPTLPDLLTVGNTGSESFTPSASFPVAVRSTRTHRKQSSYSSVTSGSSMFDNNEVDEEQLAQQGTPPSTDDEMKPSDKNHSICSLPYYSSPSIDTTMGGAAGLALLPLLTLSRTSCFQLAFQLHRMYSLVLACQESMWEVLTDRIRNRESELKTLGWDDDDLEGEHARQRFDLLLERYQSDMQTRVAIWHRTATSESPAFKVPKQGMKLTEFSDEDQVYRAILDAQKQATEEEKRMPCRTLRILVGFKSGS